LESPHKKGDATNTLRKRSIGHETPTGGKRKRVSGGKEMLTPGQRAGRRAFVLFLTGLSKVAKSRELLGKRARSEEEKKPRAGEAADRTQNCMELTSGGENVGDHPIAKIVNQTLDGGETRTTRIVGKNGNWEE